MALETVHHATSPCTARPGITTGAGSGGSGSNCTARPSQLMMKQSFVAASPCTPTLPPTQSTPRAVVADAPSPRGTGNRPTIRHDRLFAPIDSPAGESQFTATDGSQRRIASWYTFFPPSTSGLSGKLAPPASSTTPAVSPAYGRATPVPGRLNVPFVANSTCAHAPEHATNTNSARKRLNTLTSSYFWNRTPWWPQGITTLPLWNWAMSGLPDTFQYFTSTGFSGSAKS